jgi:hypothetical protein
MAVVKINSIQSVEVDGVDIGSLASADKLLTFEQIQEAVVEWSDRERAAMQAVFSKELQRTAEDLNAKGLELQQQAQEQIDGLTTRAETAEATGAKHAADNANLRQSLANYMLATDGGQAALKEFKSMALAASIAAQQSELDRLNG